MIIYSFRLQPEAKTAFMDMADTLKEEKGLTILITSAYRSYEYQEMLFNKLCGTRWIGKGTNLFG